MTFLIKNKWGGVQVFALDCFSICKPTEEDIYEAVYITKVQASRDSI